MNEKIIKKVRALTKPISELRSPFHLYLRGLSFQEVFTSYDIHPNSFYSFHPTFQYKGQQLKSLVGPNQQHLKINTLTQRCVTFLLWNYWCRATQRFCPTESQSQTVLLGFLVLSLLSPKQNPIFLEMGGLSQEKKQTEAAVLKALHVHQRARGKTLRFACATP